MREVGKMSGVDNCRIEQLYFIFSNVAHLAELNLSREETCQIVRE